MRVLIISQELRLTGLVQKALGPDARLSTIDEWSVARNALTQVRFDLICLDYESIRRDSLEVAASLKSLLAKLNTTLCLLARRIDADVEQFQSVLPRLDEVIDMSKGKEHFHLCLSRHKQDEETDARLQLEAELTASLDLMRKSSKYDVFGLSKGCGQQALHARYRALVKQHHPDVYGNISPRVKEISHEIFITLKEYYVVLLEIEPATALTPVPQQLVEPPDRTDRADTARADTRARLESLSGFKAKQARHSRNRGLSRESEAHFPELDMNSDVFLSEISDVQELAAETSAAERKQKVEALASRSQEFPRDGVSPARRAFNTGYLLYKENKFPEAFALIERSFELSPDAANTTYYAYLLFKLEPEKYRVSERLLIEIVDRGEIPENRQALPDAHLFLAHLLKARNQIEMALEHYQMALKLNPRCPEAGLEIRRAELRAKRLSTNPGELLRKIFKK